MTDTSTCKRCNGVGKVPSFPSGERNCYSCEGRGFYTKPDFVSIIAAIKGRGGKGLRSKRPDDGRAYYVWRMARFHGGADVTMPVMAITLEIEGDPYRDQLDKLADLVATRVFGTRMAAAHRWGHAMGYLTKTVPGLPDSAYPGGRVADADKPLEELAELL